MEKMEKESVTVTIPRNAHHAAKVAAAIAGESLREWIGRAVLRAYDTEVTPQDVERPNLERE